MPPPPPPPPELTPWAKPHIRVLGPCATASGSRGPDNTIWEGSHPEINSFRTNGYRMPTSTEPAPHPFGPPP